MSRVVVFFKDGPGPLFFNDFSGNASWFSGLVENGLWEASYGRGVLKAMDSNDRTRNEVRCEVKAIVKVPNFVVGNYNEVIAWAERQIRT